MRVREQRRSGKRKTGISDAEREKGERQGERDGGLWLSLSQWFLCWQLSLMRAKRGKRAQASEANNTSVQR